MAQPLLSFFALVKASGFGWPLLAFFAEPRLKTSTEPLVQVFGWPLPVKTSIFAWLTCFAGLIKVAAGLIKVAAGLQTMASVHILLKAFDEPLQNASPDLLVITPLRSRLKISTEPLVQVFGLPLLVKTSVFAWLTYLAEIPQYISNQPLVSALVFGRPLFETSFFPRPLP